MKYLNEVFAATLFLSTAATAIVPKQTPKEMIAAMPTREPASDNSYCETHQDEPPIASHPECYCEIDDDDSLPAGEGC